MKVKALAVTALLLFSTTTFAGAGVLEDEWTEGMYKYCKYSDGVVIKIGLVSFCPQFL